jgi:hypothetical protein
MQVYNYYKGKGSCTPAVKRSIIETELIDAYHWLPQDIAKIPYNFLQKFYIIKRQKNQTKEENAVLEMEQRTKTQSSKNMSLGSNKQKRR